MMQFLSNMERYMLTSGGGGAGDRQSTCVYSTAQHDTAWLISTHHRMLQLHNMQTISACDASASATAHHHHHLRPHHHLLPLLTTIPPPPPPLKPSTTEGYESLSEIRLSARKRNELSLLLADTRLRAAEGDYGGGGDGGEDLTSSFITRVQDISGQLPSNR